jgi:8-oxo-dGTP pyrophosphatase MutT (NUDIX family)
MSINKIIEALSARMPQTLEIGEFKLAAVLVPIQQKSDGDHLVLTQRAEGLNSHGGQIAFPGGRIDPSDSRPLAAALRESEEEIGLKPGAVRVLGALDQVTAASDYLITPYVGVISHLYDFRLNLAEATEVFSVPVSALLQPGCFKVEPRLYPPERPYPIYHFYCQGRDIWGATARIIMQLLEIAYGFEKDSGQ